MPTKLMMIFVGMDFVFAGCGGLLLGFSLMSEQRLRDSPTVNNVAENLLLGKCPLTGTTPSPRTRDGPPIFAALLWRALYHAELSEDLEQMH